MAQPANFGTLPIPGVDVTNYYVVSASTTPETPAAPFQTGTMLNANNGAEFVFVQASTSISFGDFVAITNGLLANSATSTNVQSSLGCRLAMAGATVKQSVTFIPGGAFFWAQTRGVNIAGNTVAGSPAATLGAAPVQLYTSATAGAITSTSAATAVGLNGIEVIVSALSGVNPTYDLVWPRAVTVFSSTSGTVSAIAVGP